MSETMTTEQVGAELNALAADNPHARVVIDAARSIVVELTQENARLRAWAESEHGNHRIARERLIAVEGAFAAFVEAWRASPPFDPYEDEEACHD